MAASGRPFKLTVRRMKPRFPVYLCDKLPFNLALFWEFGVFALGGGAWTGELVAWGYRGAIRSTRVSRGALSPGYGFGRLFCRRSLTTFYTIAAHFLD